MATLIADDTSAAAVERALKMLDKIRLTITDAGKFIHFPLLLESLFTSSTHMLGVGYRIYC